MNTRGACENEAYYIKENNCCNFCSIECRLIYRGDKKPKILERKKFDDPERQHLHDLYLWALTDIDPRKPPVEPMKRGVKLGSKRGPYKKKKRREKRYTFVCKGCGGTYKYYSKRKKYHSDACRRAYWRRKKKQKDAEERMKRHY
jgi:hypothetical protein